MGRPVRGIGLLILMLVIVALVITAYFRINESPEEQAVATVATFYTFEQAGKFASSWAMFHPLMKKKFTKGHYIQDRAHVFMNHFGVITFTYTLSEATKVKNWKMEKGADSIDVVYKVTVNQLFKGEYGNFHIVQDVYATMLEGKWTVLWDYKK